LTDPDIVFSKIDIDEKQKEALLHNINKKLSAPPTKMRARFHLTCYNYSGVVAIRESLLAAKKAVNDDTW
jgi:translation initiation factor 2 alpha subunit (eIF-2alpha)